MNGKERDYLLDNYKALLMLLVVVGHFIELSYQENTVLYHLKWLVVSFHMPAFIFISGYFSKRELPAKVLVQKLLIPYLVYELMYYFLYVGIIGKETGLYLMRPKFSLWYIQALFIWKLITPYVKRIPHHMLLSVVAGLLIGCTGIPSNFLSIPRVLVFYPFFLAGLYTNREMITRFRKKRYALLSAGAIVAFVLYLVTDTFHRGYSVKIFYGRYNYRYLEQGMLEGILCRLVCLAIGAAMTLAVMMLMTEKRTFYSYIGTRTMGIYLFHGLLYSYLKGSTNLLENISTVGGAWILLLSCVLVTAVFSMKPFTVFTNKVALIGGTIETWREDRKEWWSCLRKFYKYQSVYRML